MQRLLLQASFVFALFAVLLLPSYTFAAVSDWVKGVHIMPRSTTDFAGDGFKQSVQNAKAAGATYISLIIPWYQSSKTSADIQRGANTPTDAALTNAISYIHGQGLKVKFTIHLEAYGEAWRAHIDPSDRPTWYKNYGDMLVHYGNLGRDNGVELISIGTEMVFTAADNVNSANTAGWRGMIDRIRGVYPGKLMYGATSVSNQQFPLLNEKIYIKFWDKLDYVGISPYYGLNTPGLNTNDNSVANLKAGWNYWRQNDIQAFAQTVGKPLIFSEIGYRSIPNSHVDPWNYERQGPSDQVMQANAYEALMSYWNDYPYFAGVIWWEWDINPGAGGSGDTNYTSQRKQAEQVLVKWFKNNNGQGTPTTTISVSATAPSGTVPTGSSVALAARVNNPGSAIANPIIDFEIYNQSGTRVAQKVVTASELPASGQTQFATDFTPTEPGTYNVSVGVFSNNWSTLHVWGHHVTSFAVSGQSTPAITITSWIPSNLAPGTNYTLKWTDTSPAGTQYLLSARPKNASTTQVIVANMTAQVVDGAKTYTWNIGQTTSGQLAHGDYVLVLCYANNSGCATTSEFKVVPAPTGQSSITVVNQVASPALVGSKVIVDWRDTMTNNNRDNRGYNLILRSTTGETDRGIVWGLDRPGDGSVTKSYEWTVGQVVGSSAPAPGTYFIAVCHDYLAPCNYTNQFQITNTPATSTPTTTAATIDLWWPADGVTMYGTQPLKGLARDMTLDQYRMYWQVDGGTLVEMYDSQEDYPHKEAVVDFTGWTWKGRGPYTLTFVVKNLSGQMLAEKSVQIFTP